MMSTNETISKIQSTKTMPELDDLRKEVAVILTDTDRATFDQVQGAFRKAKNRLNNIPFSQRNGW